MDNKFDLAAAIIGAVVTPLIGGVTPLMIILLYIMGLDIASGLLCGITGVSHKTSSGNLTSSAMFRGLVKKVSIFAVIGLGYQLEAVTNIAAIRDGVVVMYIAEESLSCTENLGLLGVAIPEPIQRAIEVLKDNKEETK